MATENEINQKVEEKTSFGNYVFKNLKIQGMLIGGALLGEAAGYAATKSTGVMNGIKRASDFVMKRLNPQTADAINVYAEHITPKAAVVLAGGIAGSGLAGIPNTYAHWREGKKAQLRVEEMAEDVIALREQRNAAMAALREQAAAVNQQNSVIKEILEQGPKNPHHHAAAHAPADDHGSRAEKHHGAADAHTR